MYPLSTDCGDDECLRVRFASCLQSHCLAFPFRSQQSWSRGRSPGRCQIQVPRGFCAGAAELEPFKDSTVHIR